MVLDGLKDKLMEPDAVKEFVAEFHRELNRLSADKEARHSNARRDLERVERELRAIVDAVKRGAFSSTLQQELAVLEARKADLEREASAPAPTPVYIHPNASEIYREKVMNLQQTLDNPSTRREAAEALRGLIEEIRVTPTSDGNTVELVGELASLLRIAGTKTASVKEAARSGLLVAGACNHRQFSISVAV